MRRAIIGALVLCLVLGASVSAAFAAAGREVLFRDAENGYFSIVTPRGWVVERYDDERTKIAWREPSDERILLRVIARQATEDFAELLSNATEMAGQWAARGIVLKQTQISLADTVAILLEGDVPGIGRTRIILFLLNGVHFNCQFAAPTTAQYNSNLNTAMTSLGTIATLPGRVRDAEKRRAELLSWYTRYSSLMEEFGDSASAMSIAREGLSEFPNNEELEKMAGATREVASESGTVSVAFSYVPADVSDGVFVAGDFNWWNPALHQMLDLDGDGVYSIVLDLAPGEYQYKFVVDGRWYQDPENEQTTPDGFGGSNSIVLVVGGG